MTASGTVCVQTPIAGLVELALRDPSSPPLQIMACENAINATDLLRDEIVALSGDAWDALAGRAVFANTAVDRIVPAQPDGGGVDVTVEPFYEWAIERPPFGDEPPVIPGAHFVDDLAPYIERKLFTVNTGHAATAYFVFVALDDEGRPRAVPPLEVSTDIERRRQRAAKLRQASRMQHKEAIRAERDAHRSSSA